MTTLYDTSNTFNKLELNWSKTFFKFVTNNYVKLLLTIVINNNIVKVVRLFKLLGVIKLDFLEHCSNIKPLINGKTYTGRLRF